MSALPALSARHPADLVAWQALQQHYRHAMRDASLRTLFARDRQRASRYTLTAGDLTLDYSKNHLDATTRRLLVQLAHEAAVPQAVEAMFHGAAVNVTEGRAALHTALRADAADLAHINVDGVASIADTLAAMQRFVDSVQSGELRGHTGCRLTDIVNVGIGGSDLGPLMASAALRPFHGKDMRLHGVSNVDGTQLADLMAELNPATTLFVVCSKTFTTPETMSNARAARNWISRCLGKAAVGSHFVAASSNHEAMDAFGIQPAHRFGLWDWVGGRYSLWSAIGLSLALVVGMDVFRRLLQGARMMDEHFQHAPAAENMPMLLALIAIWYNNFHAAQSQAILPYDNRLHRFPAYLQQLQMESAGKRVRHDGQPVQCATGMVIWGEAGNNAQHSFLQLLHQGTRLIPVDFIAPVRSSGATQTQQDLALANCLAQSEALMDGSDAPGMEVWRVHVGNNPSNTILFPALTPEALGQLIALYEHKVFVEGVIWGINSFDQFGVELGKQLATHLVQPVKTGKGYAGGNASTAELLRRIAALR